MNPENLIIPLSECGVSRFTFQYEIAQGDCVGERKYWGTGMKNVNKNDKENHDENENESESEIENENSEKGKRESNVNKNIERCSSIVNDRMEAEEDKEVEEGGAIRMARAIRKEGMLCGVCITPHTHVSVLNQLLNIEYCTATGHVRYKQTVHNAHNKISSSVSTLPSSTSSTSSNPAPSRTFWTPLIDYVDLLAVNPGIGGQEFSHEILNKVLSNFHIII